MALTPQQQLIRRTGITGSEIASLAGMSRYGGPASIYAKKILPPGENEDDEATLAMELGNDLEEPIARQYRKRKKMLTAPCATMRHPTKRFAICTPDRGAFYGRAVDGEITDQGPIPLLSREQLALADALVQCKSTSWRMRGEWGEPGTDQIPEDYVMQETWEMGITGHKSADVAVLFDKDRFEIYHVPYSEKLFEGLYELAERFMIDHVTAQVPPPPDASEAYAELLRKAFPSQKRLDLMDAPADLSSTIIRFGLLKNAEKTVKLALKLYGNRIKLAIGEQSGLAGPFGQLTWTKNKDTVGPDFQRRAEDAVALARDLLTRLGPQMPADERAQLDARLREIAAYTKVTKIGPRVLRPKWTAGFIADISGETVLDLAALSEELTTEAGADDVGADE
jgi:putative phage-type endonuclease